MPMDLQAVIIRVPPSHYIHVLDSNSNVVRVITGPSTYTRPEHERVLEGPTKMITIPPRQYAVIRDPALRSKDNPKLVVLDEHGMVKLRDGDVEIREPEAFPDPFPLYPGETLQEIKPLRVVEPNQALRLRVVRDYVAADGTAMPTGLEFLFKGPGTYRPRVEVEEREIVDAIVVRHSEALLLRARQATKDSAGNRRTAGEEWLNREPGAYLPSIDEEVVRKVKAVTLTEQRALHMRAARTFTDVYGKLRKAGEEWLVTLHDAEVHIPDVYEVTVCEAVALTTLTSRQFCVVINPTNARSGEQRLGARELRRGECSFFLRPGEVLAEGLQDVYVLGDDEALLLQAEEAFMDQGPADDISTAERKPGDRWLVRGPREYVPPVSVRVCERRRAIALDTNEGIYVRNTTTGAVRAVLGTSHMLTAREELWAKELPPDVEELLRKQGSGQVYVAPLHHGGEAPAAAGSKPGGNVVRDKSRVVQFRVPNNAAVQVYDFKAKSSRVVVGPDLICLDPDEQFTSLSLSGGAWWL
jgi:major vault protein